MIYASYWQHFDGDEVVFWIQNDFFVVGISDFSREIVYLQNNDFVVVLVGVSELSRKIVYLVLVGVYELFREIVCLQEFAIVFSRNFSPFSLREIHVCCFVDALYIQYGFISNMSKIGLVSYFSNFDNVAYDCCLCIFQTKLDSIAYL